MLYQNDLKRSSSKSKSLGWCIPWWPTSKCDHAWSRLHDVAWSPPRFRRPWNLRDPRNPRAPARRVHSRRRAKEMLCSWPSLPRRFRSDHPLAWQSWQGSKGQGGSIKISWNINVFTDASIDITAPIYIYIYMYRMIWYNMMWYDMVWYAMLFVYTHLVNITNITHQICHVFAHVSTVWYQIHNLIMSLLFPGTVYKVYNSSYW